MELREARADNLKNEAKILELQDELAELKSKTARFESGTETSVITAQHNGQQLETLLANANKLLDESREDVNKKNQQINELEIKLNSQINRQKEMGNGTEREMKQKLTSAEVRQDFETFPLYTEEERAFFVKGGENMDGVEAVVGVEREWNGDEGEEEDEGGKEGDVNII